MYERISLASAGVLMDLCLRAVSTSFMLRIISNDRYLVCSAFDNSISIVPFAIFVA